MGFDVVALKRAVLEHGPVCRVVIADMRGSSPREVGASMLVWPDGQSGTIGGGALEFQAAQAARSGKLGLSRHALGPDLGQCCGGMVTLLTERYTVEDADGLPEDVVARRVQNLSDTCPPLSVQRILNAVRSQGARPEPQLSGGWMVEPVHHPTQDIWIWGAGHVGRALVDVLAPLPDVSITWVDTGPARFPDNVPNAVTILPAADPANVVAYAPIDAAHLILTYSHALDLELCHQVLLRGFGFAGLIGSATKWARFRSRLATLGHSAAQISGITCPIGEPELSKHPHSIAIGVARQLLSLQIGRAAEQKGKTA